jgi:hypothetical protein
MEDLANLSSDLDTYHRKKWNVDNRQMTKDLTPVLELILEGADTILADPTAFERWMEKVNCEF